MRVLNVAPVAVADDAGVLEVLRADAGDQRLARVDAPELLAARLAAA